jgi:serine/threonine protein kinase
MLAPNTLLQNRYQIIRSIGHGGMGAVYLARDQRLGHTVALKETFFTEERMRRAFEREARLLAHLRHPALPKVTDHFDEDGGQFIVMEFISGEDLEILLAQRGEPFEVAQVLAWADALLKALDYLHSQDPPILHRDIKPANLKLTPQGEIILLDFGLAKGTAGQTSSVMTSRSVFGFTPNFAPLEQIQGTGTGPRSDLYALAATLYYLMTGAIPPDALTRITEVANGQPDPLRPADEVNPQIPRAVAEVLMKSMAHNRDHRPDDAAEMRRMLSAAYPALADMSARPLNVNEAVLVAEAKTIMPSTIIEAAPTVDIPQAIETGATPTTILPTAKQPVSELETVPAEVPALEVPALLREPEERVRRLPWAVAGVAALLLIAVTFGLISYSGKDKTAGPDLKVAQGVSKDAGLTTAPNVPVSQQAVAAPDDSEIVTTNAGSTKIETRTFRNHPGIAKVIVTTGDGKKTAEVYPIKGDARYLPDDRIATALAATGDELADAAGFTVNDGKTKSEMTKQPTSKKAAPPARAPVQKAVTGKKDGPSSTSPQNTTPANQMQQSQSVLQKSSQAVDSKQRFVKGIPPKTGIQPRALREAGP